MQQDTFHGGAKRTGRTDSGHSSITNGQGTGSGVHLPDGQHPYDNKTQEGEMIAKLMTQQEKETVRELINILRETAMTYLELSRRIKAASEKLKADLQRVNEQIS